MGQGERMSPAQARRLLAVKGPVTPDKLRAALFYADMLRLEPWHQWVLWLLADVCVGLEAALAPSLPARVTIVLYAVLYAVTAVLRGSDAEQVDRDNNAHLRSSDSMAARYGGRAVGALSAVIFLLAGGVAALVPDVARHVGAGLFLLLVASDQCRSFCARRRATKILASAAQLDWYASFIADREIEIASATVSADAG